MLSANGFRWFSLWFHDPAGVADRLVKAGYPAPIKGGNVSMTRDPDGNVVEIMGVPRGATGETFTWGMGVGDDAAARKFYGQVLGLRVYDPWNLPVADKRYSSWVHSALTDGRLFVASAPPNLGRGYYLMTPNPGGEPKFERIECEMAKKGVLDRVSVSPSERRICCEYQTGFKSKGMTGRTLYIADFDVEKRAITNPKPIANEAGKPFWIAYPRWIEGESAVVYHSGETGRNQLYVYRLEDGSTKRVSTNARADYRYPHGEAAPC
jgi:catechol 2,3-dioxygenase-like lactoylglutathione lyase family enzyme